jgi:hypothetical protein
MSLIVIHPIKPLLQAWKRFRSRLGEELTRRTRKKTKQPQANKTHHRHAAFFEFP